MAVYTPSVRDQEEAQAEYDKRHEINLPAGTGTTNFLTDAIGGIYGAFKDQFSAQDATVQPVNPADYYYGGSAEARNQTLQGLSQQGQDNFGLLSEIGGQEWGNLREQSGVITGAARQARDLGQAYAGQASGLSTLANQAYTTAPDTYANARTQSNWQGAIGNLSDFQPSTQTSGAIGQLTRYNPGAVDSRLGDSYAALQGYAAQGTGPSAAEAQLRQAADQNVANQIALARSGRGAGANANAARQAAFQAADIGQRTAADLATLRANEAATWRGQQLQALGAAGGLAGNIESSAQGRQGLGLQGLTSGASLLTNQDQLRLAASSSAANQYGSMYGAEAGAAQAAAANQQGYLGLALNAQGNAAGQSNVAQQTYLNGLNQGAGLIGQAGQTRLGAVQAGLGTQQAYDQAGLNLRENEAERRSRLAGTYMSESSAASRSNQSADLQKDKEGQGLIGGVLGAIGLGGIL